MHVFLALPYYLSWHYSTAYSDMVNIWKNFFVFLFNFFSITTLFSTLLSPWHKMNEGYSSGFNGIVGTLIVNIIMRIVGIFVRLLFIALWVLFTVLCLIFGLTTFLFWSVLPFLIILALLQGVYLLTL